MDGAERSRRHALPACRSRSHAILLWTCVGLGCSGADPGGDGLPADARGLDPAPSSERPALAPGARVFTEVLSIRDAVEIGGSWWILDSRSRTVHRLTAGDGIVRSVGREGDGPGELRRPAALAPVGEGFAVVDEGAGRLDLFDAEGGFVERRMPVPSSCPGPAVVVGASGSTGAGLAVRVAVRCTTATSGSVSVLVEELGGALSGEPLLEMELMDLATGAGGAMAAPLFAGGGGGVALGSSVERCVQVLRPGRGRMERCNASAAELPLPTEERRRFDSLRSALESRLPGVRLPIPERMPFFDAIFLDGEALHFRSVLGSYLRALDRMPLDGGAVRRLALPPHELSWVGERTVLLGWEREEGTGLLVLPRPPVGSGRP